MWRSARRSETGLARAWRPVGDAQSFGSHSPRNAAAMASDLQGAMPEGGTTWHRKREGGRQDADHGSGNTIYTNLPSEHVGIGVVSLPPKLVGKNGNMVGLRSGFLVCESASDHGAEPERREKIRRYAHGRLAVR